MKNGLFVVLAVAWLSWPITSSFAQIPSLSETRVKAEQGNAEAQHNLGVMYEKGLGVAKDDVQAVQWYRKAADQGHAEAQYNLGFMYAQGRGVAQDYAQAVQWYRKAADQGLVQAQINLGGMYEQRPGRSAGLCRGDAVVSQGRRPRLCGGTIQSWCDA